MTKYIRFFGVGFLFFLLILVRAFQKELFYDPFIIYFKNDYLQHAFPKYSLTKLLLNLGFRYLLNMTISIGIIYLLFQQQFIKFSIQFYSIAFIILIILFFSILKFNLFESYLPLFYIRRFLIQPLFILLLIPIFYYQKSNA